jgi:enterobacterial common antigen flippase
MSQELCTDETTSDHRHRTTAGEAADAQSLSPEQPSLAKRLRRCRTFAFTIGVSFAVVLLQLAQGILLARLLGPEGRGEYATAVLYSQLLLYVGLLGGIEVICRYANDINIDRDKLRRAALWLGITTGVLTTLVTILCNVVALPTDKRFLMPLACLCSLSVIGQQVMLIVSAVDRGAGGFGRYNFLRLFAAAAFPAILLAYAIFFSVDPTVAAILLVITSLLTMSACLVGVRNPFRGESEPRVRQLLRESRSYGFSTLVTDIVERLDLVLVLWLAPLATQGLYAAMVPAVYTLTVVPNTFGLFLFNAGASSDRQLKVRDFHRILASSIAVQFVSTVLFMLLIGPLVRLVYGEAFSEAVIYALWLAPVAAIRGIVQGLDNYLKGRGRPLAPVNSRIASAGMMLGVTAMLFPTMQTLAIPIAALVGQFVCLVWLSAIVYADTRHVTAITD